MIKAFQNATGDTLILVTLYNYGDIEHPEDINLPYVDGISLTHGYPRQHIWTFAAGLDEIGSHPRCPCTNTNFASRASQPPAFVGNDYFCDTASEGRFQNIFYPDDPVGLIVEH